MSPAERLPIAWSAFKALALKVKGPLAAAAFLRECAAALECEHAKSIELENTYLPREYAEKLQRRLAPNVIALPERGR